MTIKKMFHWVAIVVLFVLCFGQTALHASSIEDLIAEEKQHIVAKQDYALNTNVTVKLKEGQSIQLDCPSNPHEIEKFIIYYYRTSLGGTPKSIIRVDAHFKDGCVSGGGSRISSEGALRQASYTTCLMITQ